MYNILHYVDSLDLGATTKSAILLAKHLDRARFLPFFAYKNVGPRSKQCLDLFGDRLFQVRDAEHFRGILANNKIDLVHSHRSGEKHFPEVGIDYIGPKVVETSAFGGYNPNPLIDRTLFMSRWLYRFAQGNYPHLFLNQPSRFDFLNNPIELPTTGEKLDRLPTGKIFLGRCGRPDDGIYDDINVKAAFILQSKGYSVHFLVVAPPPSMIDDLMKFDIPATFIEPTVKDDTLSRFYNSVNIYCHARADSETFGSNIAEAMVHNLAVVTHIGQPKYPGMTVYGAQTELVSHGITGYVSQYDAQEYADYVEKLINDPEERFRMGQNGAAKIMSEAYIDVIITKLEKIYQEVLNG